MVLNNPWKIPHYLKDNEKEIETQKRAQLALEMYYRPGSISLLELEYGAIGKVVERQINHRTYLYFMLVFIVILYSLYFKPLYIIGNHFSIIFFLPIIPIFLKGIFRIIFYIIKLIDNEKDQFKFFINQVKKYNENKYCFFRAFLVFDSIKPFSIRNIWFWTLILGIIISVHEYFYGKLSFEKPLDEVEFISFLEDFLRYIVISIVTFIATNVIRELLTVKEKYEEGIQTINDKVKDSKDYIEGALSIVEGVEPLIKLNKNRDRIISPSILHYEDFIIKIKKFINNMGYYTKGLSSKLKISEIEDPSNSSEKTLEKDVAKICLTASIVALLENKVKKLDNQTSILTTFTNLGSITAEILKDSYGKVVDEKNIETEYYALQIKPLIKFINYPQINGSSAQEKKEWENFIKACIDHAKLKTNICRYFIDISETDLTAAKNNIKQQYFENKNKANLLEELNELSMDSFAPITNPPKIKEQLKFKIFSVNKERFKDGNEITNIRDIISNYDLADPINASKDDPNAGMSVIEVLNEILHLKGNCKIRKFNYEELQNLLLDIPINLTNKRGSFKPYDYLAVKLKNKDNQHLNDWLFCIEALYDKDLDIAQIRIFFEDECELVNINDLFFSGEEIKELEKNKKITQTKDKNGNTLRTIEKYLWKSCISCPFSKNNFKDHNSDCLTHCWTKTESKYVIVNRKLKLNEIFFGHPFLLTSMNGNQDIQLASGDKINIEHKNVRDYISQEPAILFPIKNNESDKDLLVIKGDNDKIYELM